MANPIENLPKHISDDLIEELLSTLGLPKPISIRHAATTAEYHTVYMISVPSNKRSPYNELVLRVSGNHIPKIKTENEIAVMSWVASNTTIPIPEIVAYDATADNCIGYEYTLLSRISGVNLNRRHFDQLLEFLVQLHEHPFEQIGGLALNEQGNVIVGPVVNETFWQVQDIEKYWPDGETVTSLNIAGPFDSYAELIRAQIETYIHLIQIHDKLTFMRDLIPRLQRFSHTLPQHSELNKVKLRLAHKDLHFANILYDAHSHTITAILDWEFSGIVPFPEWNPQRSFLWNGRYDARSGPEKQRLFDLFQKRCAQRNATFVLDDAAYSSPLQEAMQTATDFLRAITEVAPRGHRTEMLPEWKARVVECIARFGV